MRQRIILLTMLMGLSAWAQAQETASYTQTVRGRVLEKVSQSPLPGASVSILDTDPLIGTATDLEGSFMLKKVTAGRATIQISYLGYESITLREIPITSGKEVLLTIELQENLEQMEELSICRTPVLRMAFTMSLVMGMYFDAAPEVPEVRAK